MTDKTNDAAEKRMFIERQMSKNIGRLKTPQAKRAQARKLVQSLVKGMKGARHA